MMDTFEGSSRVAMFVAALVGLLALSPRHAGAETVVENDEMTLDVGALARGVGGVSIGGGAETQYGFGIQFARLKLSGTYRDDAAVAVQVGGASGNVRLVDAWAEIRAFDPIRLRLGRFKMSVSSERLIGAGELPFVDRALTSGYTPGRRIGLEVYGRYDVAGVELQPEVGLFQPGGQPYEVGALRPGNGALFEARLLAETDVGLDLHVGYAGLVFEPNDTERIVRYDDPLDVAVTYDAGRWDLHLEGVSILDPPTSEPVLAGYLHAGYRFGESTQIQWKPMASYDLVREGDLTHRVTAGVNLQWWDTPFETIINYRFRTSVDQTDDGSSPPGPRQGLYVVLSGSI